MPSGVEEVLTNRISRFAFPMQAAQDARRCPYHLGKKDLPHPAPGGGHALDYPRQPPVLATGAGSRQSRCRCSPRPCYQDRQLTISHFMMTLEYASE